LRSQFPSLPTEYFELLAASNGGEGELGAEPGWFQLWPAEQVEDLNLDYEVPANLPGWVGIGSNGGGELFALDELGTILMVPFIPMTRDEAVVVAANLREFAGLFGHNIDAA
jgi:hypothetical protein